MSGGPSVSLFLGTENGAMETLGIGKTRTENQPLPRLNLPTVGSVVLSKSLRLSL